MGIFDSLKKFTKEVTKDFNESGLKDDVSKIGKEFADSMNELGNNAAELFSGNSSNASSNYNQNPIKEENIKVKSAPKAYAEFPLFTKSYYNSQEIKKSNYIRFSMYFNDVTYSEISEYKNLIQSRGYVQSTDVRFDKGNTYIIVDNLGGGTSLNIVFHIKK